MAIFKLTRTVTAFFEADDHSDAMRVADGLHGLDDLAYFIDDGDGIGSDVQTGLIEVDPAGVRDELLAIGNDGTFFF